MRNLLLRIAGELEELPGLLGDIFEDWGIAMQRWTARHRFDRWCWSDDWMPGGGIDTDERTSE